ncbi:MAG: hypothetical protein ACRDQY_21955 [Pseudonocardiaceae bacterium]
MERRTGKISPCLPRTAFVEEPVSPAGTKYGLHLEVDQRVDD